MGRKQFFITGTGTGVGKTCVSRGLAAALTKRGHSVLALKPIETGCDPEPLDAVALGLACGNPALAYAAGFYRAAPPLAPYAIGLSQLGPGPNLAELTQTVRALTKGAGFVLVEGAGGILVPVTATETTAEWVQMLGMPLVLVAIDALGTLSHTLTAVEAAQTRGIEINAVVLNRLPGMGDLSQQTNQQILSERLDCPVFRFETGTENPGDQTLAEAVEASGLVTHIVGAST